MSEWQPIETAPRDGRFVRVRLSMNLAPYHVRWKDGGWQPLEFQSGGPRPHLWLPEPPK